MIYCDAGDHDDARNDDDDDCYYNNHEDNWIYLVRMPRVGIESDDQADVILSD